MLGLAIRLVTATRSPPICWAMLPQMFSAATTRNFFAPFAFDEEEPHPARRKSSAQAAARPAVSSTRAPSMVWRGVAGRNDITNLRGDRGPERKRHLVMKTVFIIDCQALCVACLRTICRGPGCYTAKRRAGQRSRYARRSAHSRARRVVRCAAALARLWRARPDRVRGARLGCSSCRTTAGHAPTLLSARGRGACRNDHRCARRGLFASLHTARDPLVWPPKRSCGRYLARRSSRTTPDAC